MVEIICICGFSADCSRFISKTKIDRWLCCPACKIKFSGPGFPTEIGIQIVDNNGLSEFIRKPVTFSDRVQLELRQWEKEKILKKKEEKMQLKESELPLFCL